MTASAITACPDCGEVSSEDYLGRGLCWTCCERRLAGNGNGAAPTCSAGHQDQDQDQDQGPGLGFLSERQSPGPGVLVDATDGDDGSDMDRLEQAHHLGELQPAHVQLGEMPPHAGRVMKSIAAHMAVRMGLRRAVGDDRPLPYAASVPVKAGLAENKRAASKAINALVRAGVIEHAGQLKPLKPGLDGTKLFRPPGDGPIR